jgi:hypothetical protein
MSALTRCESTRYVLNPQLNPKTFALYFYVRKFLRACSMCVRACKVSNGEAFVAGMCVGH